MPYSRQSFNIKEAPVLSAYRDWLNEPIPNSTWVGRSYSSSETVTGVTRRKPEGWLDPTPYFIQRVETRAPVGKCHFIQGTNTNGSWGVFYDGVVGRLSGEPGGQRFTPGDHFNGALSEANAISDVWGLRDAALIAARVKLKQTDVNLGIAFAERNRTAMLVGTTARNIGNSFLALKRGQVRRAMDILGISSKRREPRGSNVPRKWLEIQYGWKPLASDVYGAVEALSKLPASDWVVTAKATRSRVDSWVYEIKPNATFTSGYDACRVTATKSQSCFARIDCTPSNEATISLASLGITNPLLVGWELVPHSFIVDWFLPIGAYLESLDAMLGYVGRAYCSSLRTEVRWQDEGTLHVHPTNGRMILNTYTGSKRLFRLDRQVSNSPPIPSLPRFKDPRSLGHMANGLSLLASAFGRR